MSRLVYSQPTAWPRTPGSLRGTGKTGQTAQACISTSFCCSVVAYHEPHHGKIFFCTCENKSADQLPGNRPADQCLCFHYIWVVFIIHLLPKSNSSSPLSSSVSDQHDLCRTWSETPKTSFLMTQLICLSLCRWCI